MKIKIEKLINLREKWIEKKLRRSAPRSGVNRFYWQPPLLILLKSVTAFIIILKLISLHVYGGEGLEAGFQFFKLEKIFNFTFPGKEFFQRISFFLFSVIVGFPSLLFFRDQLTGLLSSVAVNRSTGRLYYIRNRIISTKTIIIPFEQIETVTLKRNIITGRLLNTGTVEIVTRSGDLYEISSIGNAESLALQISS